MNPVSNAAAAARAPTTEASQRAARIPFIDNLRWTMIVLVITMHAAVTYSNLGRWYYNEKVPLGTASFLFFATYQTWLQAFFMGFLFFIAGYFVPGAFDRKGAGRFLRDRAFRLGVPTLLYMLVIGPATMYFLLVRPNHANASLLSWFARYLRTWGFGNLGTGPLWFCLALLIFCVVYALVRMLPGATPSNAPWLPQDRHVVAMIAVMGAATFLVRTAQPVGTAILNMQLCYFADYVLLFIAGIHAGRHGWLTRIPIAMGKRWLALAVVGGGAAWFALLISAVALRADVRLFNGGWHWQSALISSWEAFFCVGVCLGLVVIFREAFNHLGQAARFMSDNAFAVYVIHPPVVIGAALALRSFAEPPVAKFIVVSAISVIVSFAAAAAIRRLPVA